MWTTNETGGTETVIDAGTAAVRGTVDLGGEVGNVAYEPATDRMVVVVQGRGDLAVIEPATLAVSRRIGCRVATIRMGWRSTRRPVRRSWAATPTRLCLASTSQAARLPAAIRSGRGPDVLAYDAGAHRLYVAAESGQLTVLDEQDGKLRVAGSDHLADGAHVVAVDLATHRSYYPIPAGSGGHPVLLERAP